MNKHKKLYTKFTYVTNNISDALQQSGIFIAVKLINLFIQTYANKETLTYSNTELCRLLGIKRVSSLHSAFLILEKDGIIKRTFKDDKKRIRGEFTLDVDKVLLWMSMTIYDEMYKKAERRSLFRVFVVQTLIFFKDIKSHIVHALGERKTEDRNAKVKAIAQKANKHYEKYINFLQKKTAKTEANRESRKRNLKRSQAFKVAFDMLRNFGYVPPDTIKN